ncbi:restriction endonuclease [Halobacterium zhouii]|uniref:restriction endonuclease n=1 Tax=Halobacterium zhouii TaxID=2902624 RepID=UPI001E3E055B|nr:restriction endonuclease [Halobacterium zhouii]
MFEEMDEPAFPEFLAAFWEEKDWETSVQPNDDGTYLVAGDKESGTRGLIGVRPGKDTEIGASEVEQFAAFCDEKGVDVRVMATRGRFTTGARSAADAGDVHLLDPNELASSVRDEKATHLVDEYSTGGGGGSLFDGLPALPFPVSGGLPSGVPVVPVLVVVVVVLAAVFAGGTLASVVPFVGGGGAGDNPGVAVTALSLGDTDNATVVVAWDARQQDEIRTKAGQAYRPPENETFVVVQLAASTTTNSTAVLRGGRFALAVNGTNYGVQRLRNATGMLPIQVDATNETRAFAVFSVPEGTEAGTLVATAGDPGVRFEREHLAFQVE